MILLDQIKLVRKCFLFHSWQITWVRWCESFQSAWLLKQARWNFCPLMKSVIFLYLVKTEIYSIISKSYHLMNLFLFSLRYLFLIWCRWTSSTTLAPQPPTSRTTFSHLPLFCGPLLLSSHPFLYYSVFSLIKRTINSTNCVPSCLIFTLRRK